MVWEVRRNFLNTIRGISIITLTTLLLVNGIMPLALWTFFFGFTIAITMERYRGPRTSGGTGK